MRRSALCVLAILWVGPASAGDGAPPPTHIYRWVDLNGVAHYTTDRKRVPEELRGLVTEPHAMSREPLSAQAPASVDAWIGQDRVAEPAAPPSLGDDQVEGAAATSRLAAIDARIAELEKAIATDEDLLKGQLIDASAPESNDALRQVATRMPGRIAELEKLRAERAALAPETTE